MKKITKLENGYYLLANGRRKMEITPYEYAMMMAGAMRPDFDSRSMVVKELDYYKRLANKDIDYILQQAKKKPDEPEKPEYWQK